MRESSLQVTPSSYTVAQYCDQIDGGTVVVNREYQRSPKVWPAAARSYLIDTILNGYPIPKLSLYQKTDLRSRRTIYEIVDGQQRTEAIQDFFTDRLRLTGKSEYAGSRLSQLDEDVQQRFLSYQLSVDIFSSATDSDIRQVFRRMNSYNVPLNRQEKRHATHQGPFKWFIVEMSELYAQALKDMGVFNESQLSRMNDARLLTDLCFTFTHGLRSQSEAALDDYYDQREEDFAEETEMRARISTIFDVILGWPDLHRGPLMTAYNFFSLGVAVAHRIMPAEALQATYAVAEPLDLQEEFVLPNLGSLAVALDDPADFPQFSDFIAASRAATNRLGPRQVRHRWLSRALEPRLIVEATTAA